MQNEFLKLVDEYWDLAIDIVTIRKTSAVYDNDNMAGEEAKEDMLNNELSHLGLYTDVDYSSLLEQKGKEIADLLEMAPENVPHLVVDMKSKISDEIKKRAEGLKERKTFSEAIDFLTLLGDLKQEERKTHLVTNIKKNNSSIKSENLLIAMNLLVVVLNIGTFIFVGDKLDLASVITCLLSGGVCLCNASKEQTKKLELIRQNKEIQGKLNSKEK